MPEACVPILMFATVFVTANVLSAFSLSTSAKTSAPSAVNKAMESSNRRGSRENIQTQRRADSVKSKSAGFSKVRVALSKAWQFREVGKDRWYPASVPGCVHTDLLNNRLIEDPFYRDNL